MRTSLWVGLLVALLFSVDAQSARAALSDELQFVSTQSHSLSYGRSADFYKKFRDGNYGFSLDGVMSSSADILPHLDVNHGDTLTTLIVNGSYDLPARLKGGMDFHPFLMGGAGVALYDSLSAHAGNISTTGTQTQGDMVPLFRFGGGIAYKVDKRLGLALSYKTGFTGGRLTDVNMQMVDVGLKFRF